MTVYAVQPQSEDELARQRSSYRALLSGLGTATQEQIQAALDSREPIEPEPGLDDETVRRLRERIERARGKDSGA